MVVQEERCSVGIAAEGMSTTLSLNQRTLLLWLVCGRRGILSTLYIARLHAVDLFEL